MRSLLVIGALMYFFVGGTDFDALEQQMAEQERQALLDAVKA